MKYLTEVPKNLLGCSIDPVTLGTIAIGALGGLGASAALGSGAQPSAPTAPASPPPPQQNPVGSSTSNKPQTTPSFVGSSAVPQQTGYGQKTLLGQ